VSQADRICQFVVDHCCPCDDGRTEIIVRAGDVHRAMGLANAMPAVCSAIGSNKFEQFARVTLIKTIGPAAGANVYFSFSLTASLPERLAISQRKQPIRPVHAGDVLDLADAIVLISCVKSKLPHPPPARSLYTSTWFRKVRDLVEIMPRVMGTRDGN
jgi:hypothetical protein